MGSPAVRGFLPWGRQRDAPGISRAVTLPQGQAPAQPRWLPRHPTARVTFPRLDSRPSSRGAGAAVVAPLLRGYFRGQQMPQVTQNLHS